MQQWLQRRCADSLFDESSFQDLRQQLSRLAVQMCDCWSQVHVSEDPSTRWTLLHELLRFHIAPSDTLAASVDTCCGCAVLRPLRADVYGGASEDEQVDWEESSSVSSHRQPSAPGREALLQHLVPGKPGEALRRWQDEQWHASSGSAWAPATDVWPGRNEAGWEDASHARAQATSSRSSRFLSEGNSKEVRLSGKRSRREQDKRRSWTSQESAGSRPAQTWSYSKRQHRARSLEEHAKRREPRTFHTSDNRSAPKASRGGQSGRQEADWSLQWAGSSSSARARSCPKRHCRASSFEEPTSRPEPRRFNEGPCPKRHCRASSFEEQTNRPEPRSFNEGDNRLAKKAPRGRQPGRQFATAGIRWPIRASSEGRS